MDERNEQKLSELFRDAVPSTPAPSFDHGDIVAESDRQRARSRRALLGGSALGALVLAGVAVLGVALWRTSDAGDTTTAAGPMVASGSGNGQVAPNEVPNEDAQRGTSDKSFSPESPKQGGTPTENAGSSGAGSTPSGCEKADLGLAAALAGELQAAESSALPANITCPPQSRGVAFRVGGGVISVIVAPKDAQFANPAAGHAASALRAATASDGRHVILVSEAAPGSGAPPLEAQLQDIVDRVAAKV